MTKYIVYQERSFTFVQEVEAESRSKAILVAEELNEWELDNSTSNIVYDYDVHLAEPVR
jgi:dsDNA-binding SOS-regulon protein